MTPSISRSALINTMPTWGFPVALLLTLGIGVADYLSGYEHRLAMLYLGPLAVATWGLGVWAGMVTTLVAVVCWLASFYKRNFYTDQALFFWEGLELLVIFTIFVQVLWRLRLAMQRADQRFERVLEGLDAGIYVVVPTTGDIVYTNPQLHRMLGLAADSSAMMRFERQLDFPRSASSGPYTGFLSQEIRMEDDCRDYLAQSGLIPWEAGQTGRLTVVRDITDQKRAEQARRRQQEILSNTARAAVLAEISTTLGHELNQPLMAISSYLQASILLLSKRPDVSADILDALKKCQDETSRAGRILNGTRQFLRQRIPARNGDDVNAVIRRAVEAVQGNMPGMAATISLALDESLPLLLFDETLIEQVLINLITNAAQSIEQHADAGEIVVRSQAEDEGVRVSVADNGAGIPADITEQIFLPFFTTKPNGLGLGLSICRSVVEAHGGHIRHRHREDGGATFEFSLPAA